MIIEEFVEINVVPATLNYWKNNGYDQAIVGQKLKVSINHLPSKSQIYVECKCENCLRIFKQRFSRDKSICGSCRISQNMKGNSNGRKNIKHIVPSKQELITVISNGKNFASKHFNVSISVINRWMNHYDISLPAYYGKKYFKTEEEKQKFLENVNSDVNISELSRISGVPLSVLNYMKKNKELNIETQFDIWKKNYENILQNIDLYVKENKKKNLIAISNEFNISVEQLKKAFRETNNEVRLHSYNKSKGEVEMKEYIKSLGVDCFSMMFDKSYEIDCYVPKKHFGIEYCGEYWHRFVEAKNNKNNHKNKMDFINGKNITILTIFESEWINKKEIVKSIIKSKLGFTDRIFARKCIVKEITKSEAKFFHNKNHLAGSTNSTIDFGLFYKNSLVSVLSMIKSRFDKNYQYEISRYSSKCNMTIVGGLGKMFNYFHKKYKPKSVMTYVDLRIGNGKSYEKIGFECFGNTQPNYFYFHPKIGYLESRMKFQKHNLKKILPKYNDDKTEFENMELAGYYRIYDCGNKKYSWKEKTGS